MLERHDGAFWESAQPCYFEVPEHGDSRVERVNLLEYFELAEAITRAKQVVSLEQAKGGRVWVATSLLPDKLKAFVAADNGFSSCKHAAENLAKAIEDWFSEHMVNEDGELTAEKFEVDFPGWRFSEIDKKLDAFKSVFEVETRDVDVYSVGQVAIYRTSSLVSSGRDTVPAEYQGAMPAEALGELDQAGKCLAFDLPTACGFHALRSLELVMDVYLDAYGVNTSKFKSWNDYIKAATRLVESEDVQSPKPAKKVTAMLDRMRELDRNPLMHPRDTLDQNAADQLYKLCGMTIVEMIKDMPPNALMLAAGGREKALIDAGPTKKPANSKEAAGG